MKYITCDYCRGTGELWIECCNGSDNCACKGDQIMIGNCQVCDGKRKIPENTIIPIGMGNPNSKFIKNHLIGIGYVNPSSIIKRR